ncbi:hypothetical protein CLDAP_17760 [Caldilinea aerophila DSM 14535 = NBRC 104270]|uniref:Uncharacterized protein n=1 Tax=Caldilinea aerophila (strain DSM 14535 / JCM 11387 / NBRC 104270 / STL-6-O1) TaxID=926550 RepID=I0I3H8_CALAS|nr:hypothetical protein CLDAP_17760 [Caldilinea aerophila DSM 14535 = NBRC 104270]
MSFSSFAIRFSAIRLMYPHNSLSSHAQKMMVACDLQRALEPIRITHGGVYCR